MKTYRGAQNAQMTFELKILFDQFIRRNCVEGNCIFVYLANCFASLPLIEIGAAQMLLM
jgi:hypothetical protein